MTMKEPPPPRCPDHGRINRACDVCVAWSRWYARDLHRRQKLGQIIPRQDSTLVADHIRQLRATMTMTAIVERSGVGRRTIERILRERGPGRTVLGYVAAAILGVRPATSPRRLVDATGTRRKLQAMMAGGWSRNHLAAELHTTDDTISTWAHRSQVQYRYVEAVDALYRRVGHRDGPSRKAAEAARAFGYLTHWAWDDDTIDDPAAEPIPYDRSTRHLREMAQPARDEVDPTRVLLAITGGLPRSDLTTAETVEVVSYLRRQGWEWQQIGARLRWSDTPDRSTAAAIRFAQTHGLHNTTRELVAA
jgi:hypothetical protein